MEISNQPSMDLNSMMEAQGEHLDWAIPRMGAKSRDIKLPFLQICTLVPKVTLYLRLIRFPLSVPLPPQLHPTRPHLSLRTQYRRNARPNDVFLPISNHTIRNINFFMTVCNRRLQSNPALHVSALSQPTPVSQDLRLSNCAISQR
jgi:hypothetical protein